jgi:Tfp pilus assembly protein PilN
MRRIDFDYAERRPRLGWLLLIAGGVLAAAFAYSYAILLDEAAQWEAALAKTTAPKPHVTSTQAGAQAVRLDQEVEQANDVIRRLSLPWNELFKAMEDAAIDKVALLSVQPDPQQQVVNLNGEAKAYADVLTYLERLDSSETLTKVRLVSHETKRDDPHHPVAFTVTAQWRTAR